MILSGDLGVYKVTWEDDTLELVFERFREDRGSVRAEVWVRDHALPSPHVAFDTVNLGSKRTKSGFAKELEGVYPGRPWASLLEAACIKVLLAYRQGEPVVNIQDVELSGALRYRVNPFVFNVYPTLMYGDGGIGKSMFAAYLAVLLEEGWITEEIEVEPCQTLYLDWESSGEELAERADMLAGGLELEWRPKILYRYCSRPLADDFDYIKRIVVERDIHFMVVDSAGPAAGNPLDVNDVIQFYGALRALKVSSLILGHQPAKGENPYGNRYWWNYARQVWHMKGEAYPGQEFSDIALFNTKSNRGRLHTPMGFRLQSNDNRMAYIPIDPSESEELASGVSLKQRVISVVTSRAMHYKAISETLSVTDNAVKVCLSRNKNIFQSLGNGVYGLASTYDEKSYTL